MKRKIALEIIYMCFIILWGYAAFSKLFAYEIFTTQLEKSPLLHSVASIVAIGIPLIEIALTVLLVLDKTKKLGLIGSFALMTIFTIYLIGILNFSNEIPCSCGGLLQTLTWTQHVYFNISFIALASVGLYIQSNRYSLRMERKVTRNIT